MHREASRNWDKLGDENPYFGVLSSDRYGLDKLTPESLADFFRSGDAHIREVLTIAAEAFSFLPHGKALDFGCGVGRLTVPLANQFDQVVGVDISAGMLNEARAITMDRPIDNIQYVDNLAGAGAGYTFIHSYILFQHIQPKAGYAILEDLLGKLVDGGIGALHFTYGVQPKARFKQGLRAIAKSTWISRIAANVLTGRRPNAPAMQMNNYDLPTLLAILRGHGIKSYTLYLVEDWEHVGAMLFFKKPAPSVAIWANPAP